jgi:hypothetical protein
MSRACTIDIAAADHRLLGAALGDTASWRVWLIILKTAFGLLLTDAELKVFRTAAGERAPPTKRVRELWAIAGRRGGKSRIAALIACYIALFVKHKLAPGERGMVLVLAASVEQAKVVFGYALAFLQESATLRREIIDATTSEIRLRNGIVIAVHSNSFRTIRGRTLVACIADEIAFWRDELSAMPDVETYRAVLPALATTKGMLVGISTGYRRTGLLYQKHRDHFGQASDDTLVVQGSTLQFNGTLDEAAIAAQRAADPAAASSEWDGTFREDISTFLDEATIERAIEYDRPLELPPRPGYRAYRAFVDASGGVGSDSYTLAIGHKEKRGQDEVFVVDMVRGTVGKFDPADVTQQYATLLQQYKIRSVTGDAYGAEWVSTAWAKCHVSYSRSELPKSQIYLESIPLFTRGLVQLPEHPTLLRELRLLERRTHRSGRDSVDHPRNGRDDHANAVCGVLRSLSDGLSAYNNYSAWVGGTPSVPDDMAAWRRLHYPPTWRPAT